VAITPATFKAEYAEFEHAPDAIVQAKLDEAYLRVGVSWGEHRDLGAKKLAAHLLWMSPLTEPADRSNPGDVHSDYLRDYDQLLAAVRVGFFGTVGGGNGALVQPPPVAPITPVSLVSSVFGRIGAILAALGDYATHLVTNTSSVPGATLSDALEGLAGQTSGAGSAAAAAQAEVDALEATVSALDGELDGVAAQVAASVPMARLISTSLPLLGGGDLSADRTLSLQQDVANAAALAALDCPAGTVIFVQSVRDYFLARASTMTLVALVIVAHPNALMRWERLGLNHVSWAAQTTWEIDPAAGSDEATGLPGAAIKTWTELIRRVGYARTLLAPGVTITLSGSLPISDPMVGDWVVVNGAKLVVNGLPSEVFSGTISAKQDLNTATNLETQATSTWTPAAHLNRLCFDQNGLRYAWIAKDLGSGNARLSPWSQINEASGGVTALGIGHAAIGSAVKVYTLPTVATFMFTIRGTAGSTSPCMFQKLDFTGAGGTMRFFAGNAQPQFQNCRFSGAIRFGAGTNVLNNCSLAADGNYAIDFSAYVRVQAGLCTVAWGGVSRPQCFYELRSSPLMQGASMLLNNGTIAKIDSAYFMDVAGNPISVAQGASLQLNGTLNGSGNTGVSLAFQQTTSGQYLPAQGFGIVSAGGDISVGGATTAFAIDPATGLPSPAARATSFANLLAAYAADGFGGCINDPVSAVRFGRA
jgi:hypothetical protein